MVPEQESTTPWEAPGPVMVLEVTDSVTRLDATEWDALLSPTDYFRHGYLAALEASGLDCQFHYATLRAGDRLVGASFGCLTRFELKRWRPRVWLGGSPVNLGEPFAFAPGYDTPAARHRLQRALFAKARQAGALYFILRDFSSPGEVEGPGAAVEPSLRLIPIPLHRTALLPLEFKDFEGYLSSLKGSRRKSVRRDIKAVQAAGLRLSLERPAPELAPRLLELWLNLYHKYRDPDQIRLTEGYFRALAERPEAHFLMLWQGDRLVAFDLCLRFGELLCSVFSGLAPEVSRELPVHRYMGLEIVRHAISSGCRKIDFGISNEAAKERIGCHLELLYGYGRPVSEPLRRLGLGRLVRTLIAAPKEASAPEGRALKARGGAGPAAAPAVLQGWRRVVVLGAGLSGLAAAARLVSEPRLELVVLEQTEAPGGMCRTVSFERDCEGFIAGCNLFSPRLFALLEHAYRIRLPTRRARLLTCYDGRPLDPRTLASHLLSSQGLAALGRLTGGWLRDERALSESIAGSSALNDLALLPLLLQGQAPWHWSVRSGLANLRAITSDRYPVPGLPAIPRALERVIIRNPTARIIYQAPAQSLMVQQGRVVGARTPEADWQADIVISSLPVPTTRALLGSNVTDTGVDRERPAGLSAMAVFLLLDPGFSLLKGFHSLSFVEPDVLGQLRELFAGQVPARPCFELVCPDMAEGRPLPGGWRVTLFATFPAQGSAVEAEQLWARMSERLEQQLPGFARAVRWCKVVPPGEYEEVVGCSSQLSPYADAPPRAGDCLPWFEGLHLTYSCADAGDTLLAVRAGTACAERVLAVLRH